MRIFLFVCLIILVAGVCVFVFLQLPDFGAAPQGERLLRVQNSPNFRDGAFQNLSHTPDLAEDVTYAGVMVDFMRGNARSKPSKPLPSMKTDLKALKPDENILVWFGHSSYFIQVDGKRILVDPVFSGQASPVPFTVQAFAGTDQYTAEDMPEIDYLFLSHDHWDHMDYRVLKALEPKIKLIICGLGVGAHLERWGFANAKITEGDWWENVLNQEGFKVDLVPARHFSGRSLKRNQTLWTAFVLQTPSLKIFLGGDSGYDTHFKDIGEKFGPFDLAILENGQYDPSWRYIHMMPEEVITAGKELNAERIMPVHSAKFVLANHAWDDPLRRVTKAAQTQGSTLVTPIIGQSVDLSNPDQVFEKWWESVD
jgi:L-ascorbate metabolism protein UlaG (beta-lactamase superfamily)